MATPGTNLEASSLTPTALISLFLLDLTPLGINQTLFFHDGSSNIFSSLVYAGQAYLPFPIAYEGFSYNGDGQVPRPKLHVSNINGFVSQYLRVNQDLIGAKVSRRRVFARFLDAVNWPGGKTPYTPDPNAAYPDEIFYLNRKIQENRLTVTFELATAFELDGVKLPGRQMLALVCAGFRYREVGTCNYSGLPIADASNNTFAGTYGMTLSDKGLYTVGSTYARGDYVYLYSTIPQFAGIKFFYVCNTAGTANTLNGPGAQQSIFIADTCSKGIGACRLRFPAPQALRGSFFPGISLTNFVQSF